LFVRSKKKAVKRVPTFGDYAINHPILTEINPKLMLMSPNIRYTDSVNFVIAKGQAQPRKKKSRPPKRPPQGQAGAYGPISILAAKIKAHPA